AYRSFGGEVEASSTPTICRLSDSRRHQLSAIARLPIEDSTVPKQNFLIVRAAGRQLDLLRGEASRIAKSNNADWWIDRAEVGARFCFEDVKAKESFALTCDNFGIPCQDG
ncbi:hypothetical protein, partial [Bradyrhizobium sp. 87]|uniref:hypothetical protein n=1 Tax=Bradyrhizobium sp. 87 TaxID=2782682 RepID=UPI001FF8C39E